MGNYGHGPQAARGSAVALLPSYVRAAASDTGVKEKRIMQATGHLTRSTFDRYNIGKQDDATVLGEAMEKFHSRKV
jgi:hypothetical protein